MAIITALYRLELIKLTPVCGSGFLHLNYHDNMHLCNMQDSVVVLLEVPLM